LGVPAGRAGQQLAVLVETDDGQHGDLGQGARGGDLAAFGGVQRTLFLQLPEQRLQALAVGALDGEGAGDLALADRRGAVPHVGEDLVLAGKGPVAAHSAAFAAARPPLLAVFALPAVFFAGLLALALAGLLAFALAGLLALAGAFGLVPFFSAWARSSSTSLSSVTASSARSLGRVALIRPCLT